MQGFDGGNATCMQSLWKQLPLSMQACCRVGTTNSDQRCLRSRYKTTTCPPDFGISASTSAIAASASAACSSSGRGCRYISTYKAYNEDVWSDKLSVPAQKCSTQAGGGPAHPAALGDRDAADGAGQSHQPACHSNRAAKNVERLRGGEVRGQGK